jgi:hypothetical protein
MWLKSLKEGNKMGGASSNYVTKEVYVWACVCVGMGMCMCGTVTVRVDVYVRIVPV